MRPRSYAHRVIRPEMTVRQIAADFPDASEVFRRHGEPDAPPARFGHLEPLTDFARRRNVSLETLLSELAKATAAPIERGGRFAERVHHGFLLAALAWTLTLGAGWGGWLLWQISRQEAFDSVPAAWVIAHGQAQLWGFVVLFVIGISLRTVLHGAARHPSGAWVCYGLLALALTGISGSMLWSVFPASLAWVGLGSAALLGILSAGYMFVQVALLWKKWPATWVRAVIASGLWLTVWAAFILWLRWNAGAAGPGVYSEAQRMLLIELAVFGFAMNAIYGFGQMLLPGLLRIGSTRDRAIEAAHWLHNAGVIVLCLATTGLVGDPGTPVGSLLLVAAAVMFAVGHRGFVGRPRTSHGAEKGHRLLDFYPPLAFFWLLTALSLMTGGALYEWTTGGRLSHAFTGAVRHALTVGFMTTLILGVGQRLIPVLDRTILARPGLTGPILVLIGAGNLLRVGSELAIPLTPVMFRVMPVSAVLEWSALLLFALSVTATMYHRDPLLTRGRVSLRSSLAVLLAAHPWIEDRLRTSGTGYLLRTRSVPDELTIASFAGSEGLDACELVSRINAWLTEATDKPQTPGDPQSPGEPQS